MRRGEKAHRQLLLMHGKVEGRTCKQCARLQIREQSMRCDLTTPSGPAGDWCEHWWACGKFKPREG